MTENTVDTSIKLQILNMQGLRKVDSSTVKLGAVGREPRNDDNALFSKSIFKYSVQTCHRFPYRKEGRKVPRRTISSVAQGNLVGHV